MPLSPAQLATLKAAILADPVLNAQPNTGDGAIAIAASLNAEAGPNFWVWDTTADTGLIFDAITFANFVPNDTPDNTVTFQNRCMVIQTKQIALQLILQGRDTLNATRPKVRDGLSDATSNLPSGNNGALRTGGWAAVSTVLRRKATAAEKIFAVSTTGAGNDGAQPLGSTANPANPVFEGPVTYVEVYNARNLA
jgi:hypothetical protein